MEGHFSQVEEPARLVYDARSWMEGSDDTAIEHTNEVTLTPDGDVTVVSLKVTISSVGSGAKLAVFGMKWGYKAQLDKLEQLLAG